MATTNSSFKVKNSLEVLGGAAAAANTGSVLNSSDTSGAGQQGYGLRLLNTVNQTSTAAYTDLFINRTQTAAGSGAQLLIDLQVASVSKFKVTNTGEVTTSGNINVGGSGYIYGELVGSALEVTFNNPLVPGTEWPLLIASPSATYGSTQSVYLFDQITIQPSSGRITASSFAGSLTGNADTATTATHKSGGAVGQLLYQTGAGATGFVSVGSSGQVLRSAGSAIPVYSTATFADTYSASTILYSNGANTVTGLATANNGVLITSGAGVPSISSTLPTGLTIGGMLQTVSAAVSAAGATQGTATALTSDYNAVTTVGSGTGVILPTTAVGKTVIVANKGANALLVYPATSSQINALGVNNGYSMAVGDVVEFNASTTTLWYTNLTSGGGGGTVTSVSITTANGVSGSVATATTTPAITLTLGAITPSSINVSGNITSTGTARRFFASTADATIADRFFFQDSVTNADTALFTIPNGSGTIAYIGAINNSAPTNSNYCFFACGPGLASIEVGSLGSATDIPFAISVGALGSAAIQISTNGYTRLARNDTSSSGSTNYGTGILHTINQTSTAGFTDLYINRTQTAAGSGAQYLIDAQVGSASKFSVTNTGNVTATRFIGLVPPFELTRYASGYHDFVGTGSQNGYGIGASGTGAAVNELEPDGNRVGTAQFQLGTVATNSCYVATDGRAILAGGGALTCENCFKIDFLSDGTNTYTVYAGFQDSYLAAPTDGMFFRYTHGTNSGKWQAVTRSNGTETATDTGTTASTAAWNTFRVECNAGGTSVVFKINGTTVATNTTNIPTGAGRNFGHALWVIRSAGTASLAAVNVDYVWWVKEFTTAR